MASVERAASSAMRASQRGTRSITSAASSIGARPRRPTSIEPARRTASCSPVLAAEHEGGKRVPSPKDERLTIGELLDQLEADFRLRGVKWWAQAKYHAAVVRAWFGDKKASKLTAADVDRYIEARLADDYAPASVNRQTGLLAEALRLAHKRETLTNVITVRRLPERNARQGFLDCADLDKVVKALPHYLQDFTRFAYLTAWRRGELISLHWFDVDREGGVIRLRPEQSKNRHGRAVAIEGDLRGLIERRWQARKFKSGDGQDRVAEFVFHRRGRPVGDFRKAWAAACIEASLYRVVGVNPDGTQRKAPTRLFHDLAFRCAQHGARRGPRARRHGDLGPSHAVNLRSLQHHIRGGSSRGDAVHDGLRSGAAESEQCGGAASMKPESLGQSSGER